MSPTSPLDAQDTSETRRRLLAAAGEAFAEYGFKHTTVREICQRANANVAAVNYHFRDKEELYQAVFAEACSVAAQHFPADEKQVANADPRERLRLFIHRYLEKLLSPGRPAWQGKLMAREMTDPTGALEKMMEAVVRPNAQEMGEIVTLITGWPRTHPQHFFTGASIIGQCLFYAHGKPIINRLCPDLHYDAEMIEKVAEHVTTFSWAALTALSDKPTTPARKNGSAK